MPINPYQPPAASNPLERRGDTDSAAFSSSLDELLGDKPIDFSGAADADDLRRFLKKDGDIGYVFPIAMIVSLALFMLVTIGIGGNQWIPIGLYASLLLGILITVSTPAYRRSVFRNNQPNWQAPIRGQFHRHGLTLHSDNATTTFRWNGLLECIAVPELVVVRLAMPNYKTVMFNPSMLKHLDGWHQLEKTILLWQSCYAKDGTGDRWIKVRSTMRSPNRARTVPLPADAVSFSGPLTTQDRMNVDSRKFRRGRPWRAHAIRISLIVSIGGLVYEMIRMVWPSSDTVKVIVIGYAVVGIFWFLKYRSHHKRRPRLLHHLAGHLSSESIVTDLDVVNESVKWKGYEIIQQTDHHITLGRTDDSQWLHLKSEMFANHQAWQDALTLIARNIPKT
ncbi:hypothetical protein [Rubripirellula reticaptiva]|uniref:YcxB-like protein domain-containing protein n=1 Tax=Rubripirellula reticaptiva TaxID=2528013 RepID=A0A5C6EQC3_9BACT|nr:hypothetical protein [Rubripirellula reticaptiva]TWU51118.1 hypothetical protein Poly59_27070 [Rubripirellula reticaptiva]